MVPQLALERAGGDEAVAAELMEAAKTLNNPREMENTDEVGSNFVSPFVRMCTVEFQARHVQQACVGLLRNESRKFSHADPWQLQLIVRGHRRRGFRLQEDFEEEDEEDDDVNSPATQSGLAGGAPAAAAPAAAAAAPPTKANGTSRHSSDSGSNSPELNTAVPQL